MNGRIKPNLSVAVAKDYRPISFKNLIIQNNQLAEIISTQMEGLESG